jgi:hypothetical protein
MDKKSLMQNAHRITRKIVKLYGVDYRTQLGISMKYVYNQYKLYAENEIKNLKRNIILTLDKLVNTDDERFDKYFELYQKYNNLSKNIIQKSYNLKSLNAFMSNSLGNKYVMFSSSFHENYMVKDACENIKLYLKQR